MAFNVDHETDEKLDAVAYVTGKTKRDVVRESLDLTIDQMAPELKRAVDTVRAARKAG